MEKDAKVHLICTSKHISSHFVRAPPLRLSLARRPHYTTTVSCATAVILLFCRRPVYGTLRPLIYHISYVGLAGYLSYNTFHTVAPISTAQRIATAIGAEGAVQHNIPIYYLPSQLQERSEHCLFCVHVLYIFYAAKSPAYYIIVAATLLQLGWGRRQHVSHTLHNTTESTL